MVFRPSRSKLRRLRPAILVSIAILTVFIYFRLTSIPVQNTRAAALDRVQEDGVVCPKSPLMKDVFVVIRTGATEAQEKLPVHFKTILTCVPDFIIYSDMEEIVDGHQVYDILNEVNKTIKKEAPEFQLYEHLLTKGREGLDYQTMFGSGPSGALDNPGWKLDKWKFLPMVDRALQERPKAKWFVFVEPDTYLMWTNMLEYLSHFDASRPWYLGKHMYASGVLFAHGGSGFALSRPALEKVSKHWRERKTEIEQATLKGWAGDMILGKTLSDVGVPMFWAYPHLQGDSLTALDWAVEKLERQAWCYAATTFHHMSAEEITDLWQFEQTWYRRNPQTTTTTKTGTGGGGGGGGGTPLRFRDIFNNLVRHRLRAERSAWDNMSVGREYSDEALARLSQNDVDNLSLVEQNAHASFEMCRATCEQQPRCIQFSFVPGTCSVSDDLRLGHAADTQCLEYSNAAGKCVKEATTTGEDGDIVRSGWIMDRIPGYVYWLDEFCDKVRDVWITK
ncbi:glycosyltransferase family 31 protein [Xylaria cf. heliscus]|nr:glycosyltransferase family 31 protein [Xylaria cf. heliscus]